MKQVLTKNRLNEAIDNLDDSQLGEFLHAHRKSPVVKRALQELEISQPEGQEGDKSFADKVLTQDWYVGV